MTKNRFEGDPKLIVDPDGWDLQFTGGQPLMDQGLENITTIQLLTKENWVGNIFLNQNEKIGSNVRKIAAGSITISKLNDIRQAAEKALKDDVFGKKDILVSNPESSYVKINTIIKPPGSDIQKLIITKNGQNWINQINDPANRSVK